jgi:dCTP deaminase
MILTNKQIEEAYRKGDILINPFEENQIQAASYDFRVGEKGATTSTKKLVNIREAGYLMLQPGDFGVVVVLEEIRLNPQYVARFGLRSKYARKGLIATTGPQIDPGYHGKLILGITNLTPKPISLPYKDDLVSVEFHRLEEPSTKPYSGPYQDKMDIGAEEIEFITETEGMALSEMLTTLRSLSTNVAMLSTHMKHLEWIIPTVVTIGLIIIGILVTIK